MVDIEIIFEYYGQRYEMKGKNDQKIKDIAQKFIARENLNSNNICFIYGGKTLDVDKTFNEVSSKIDKERNKMNVIVVINDNNTIISQINNIKSKEIICPICSENCRISIIDYKIILYECKNGHKRNNIFLEEFNNTQMINESNIICKFCPEKNLANSYNKEFYRCLTCESNLCILCNKNHNREHNTVDYYQKYYYCNIHYDTYISYCIECKTNLCTFCEAEHDTNHKIIELKSVIPDENKMKQELDELRKNIDKINTNIDDFISKLQKIKEKLEIFYKINNDIYNNYDKTKKSYQNFQNANEIIESIKNSKINEIANDNNMIPFLLEIFNKMTTKDDNHNIIIKEIHEEKPKKEEKKANLTKSLNKASKKVINKDLNLNKDNKNKIENKGGRENIKKNPERKKTLNQTKEKKNIYNEIIIKYKIAEKSKNLKIFDEKFVDNNKSNCTIIFHDNTMKIKEVIDIPRNCKNNIEIKLKGTNMENMSYMFFNCESLISVKSSKWNTSDIINMSHMFSGCKSLTNLPDINKWNTSNVENMSYIFYGCESLTNLPDISKWNTSKMKDMSNMFSGCKSLSQLPDISKWDISNVTRLNGFFDNCEKLSSLPDISLWNTSNVTSMSEIFSHCSSLTVLPDISLWNTSNVTDMSRMFNYCSSLENLPDLSKWDISKVESKYGMFFCCSATNIPSKFE